MSPMPVPYEALMTELKAQLTGEREHDLRLLMEACQKHGGEPWAHEFAKAVGRLIFSSGLMSDEDKAGFEKARRADIDRLQEKHERAHACLKRGELNEAEQLANELLEAAQMTRDDSESIYFDFDDPIEMAYISAVTRDARTPRPCPVPQKPALLLLAEVRFRRNDLEGALEVLERAARRNPVDPLPLFIRCNFLKQAGRLEQARAEGLLAHALCWLPETLGQVYRHLAWCESERRNFDVAAALATLSLCYDFHRLGLDELRFAEKNGGLDLRAVLEDPVGVVRRSGLPHAPNPLWQELAATIAREAEAHGEADDAARYGEIATYLAEPPDLALLASRLEERRLLGAPTRPQTPLEAWLQSIQASIGGFSDGPPTDLLQKNLSETLPAELFAQVQSADLASLSGPPMDSIVRDLGKTLFAAAREDQITLEGEVAFGELPMHTTDALALRAPSGGYVVGLTSGLMIFCHAIAKLVTSVVPVVDTDDGASISLEWDAIEQHLAADKERPRKLADIVNSALRGVPPKIQPMPPGEAWMLVETLRHAAELYALAVPLVAACLDRPIERRTETIKLGSHLEAERVRVDPPHSYEVDVVALRLALQGSALGGHDFSLSMAGIEVMLLASEVLEALDGVERHPNARASFRRKLVRKALEQICPDEHWARLTNVSDTFLRILGALLDAAGPSLGGKG